MRNDKMINIAKTIQLEGLPKKWEKFEGMRIAISNENISVLDIPSEDGILRFYPTGKFAEIYIEIWEPIEFILKN